jgi:hypothetical protein
MESWGEDGMKQVPMSLLKVVFDVSDEDKDDAIVEQMGCVYVIYIYIYIYIYIRKSHILRACRSYIHRTCAATPREYVTLIGQARHVGFAIAAAATVGRWVGGQQPAAHVGVQCWARDVQALRSFSGIEVLGHRKRGRAIEVDQSSQC